MNRKKYPDQRKYKHYQLKRLLNMMEYNIEEILHYIRWDLSDTQTLAKKQEKTLTRWKEANEILNEISLRLD